MKKIWKKLLEILFMYHTFQIKTKLPPKRILKWIELFANEYSSDYVVRIENDGFVVKEKYFKSFIIGISKNTLAPIAVAKFEPKDDITTISVTLRPGRLSQILSVFLYLIALTSIFFSFSWIFIFLFLTFFYYASFFCPSRRLKKRLIAVFAEGE